ncbi:MAG TPA: DNA mismatch repair endonuclease MutL, partial [Polyangia bacterium]
GEVVERAASVVKELCENALDAGARRIEVEIDGGGRRLIRVVDDGGGMSPEEARLALRRHATSKIRDAADLWALTTFGFRGEALPSIAAVSRVSLSTKRPGATAGFRLTVEAGVETEAREVGMPEGTQVEVRDLFYNTPARLKFQKTEATEAANVSEAVLRLALAHPETHFRLRMAGRVALDLPIHRDLGERVRAAMARRGVGALHEATGREGGHEVRAFLAAPEAASATARSTFLFVARRFVRDRSLLHALALGYGELLEKGRYPLAALFLEIPGGDLDVNVHPQKLEVRFARAAEVYAAVRHVVAGAVARAPWLPAPRGAIRVHTLPPPAGRRVDGGAAGDRPADGTSQLALSHATALPSGGAGTALTPAAGGSGTGWARGAWTRASSSTTSSWPASSWPPSAPPALDPGPPSHLADGPLAPEALAPGAAPQPGSASSSPYFGSLSYIGQLDRTYLVCEAAGELVLVDQHAAHERVAYERLRAAHARREIRQQRLLFPIPIELDEAQVAAAAEPSVMERLGFDVRRGGERTLVVSGVPEVLKDADVKPLLAEVLGRLADGDAGAERGGGAAAERIDRILATMACHSVVRAGDVLSRTQAVALLVDLDAVDLRTHCPHGRPVLLRLPLTEIERRFGRA